MSSRPQPQLSVPDRKPAAPSNSTKVLSPARRFPLEAETLRNFLRKMVTLREFEHLGYREFKNGLIRGYYHSYAGQEAVGVGFFHAIDLSRDYIVDNYRDHGHMLLSGMDPMRIYAELFGRRTGVAKGKGGSMHMYSPEEHFLGGDGIVGGPLSIATGVGLALKQQKKDGVAVCFFGDGALDTGTFHESLNMASLFKVPTAYVCINNQYSMGTSLERHSAVTKLVDRARGYGMPTEQVDGQDVWATTEAAARILNTVRDKQRPYFVEVLTYRYDGHGIHDKTLNYRSIEEETSWHERDPLKLLSDYMMEEKIVSHGDIEKLRKDVIAELEAKVAEAKKGEEPAPEELLHDVLQ
ncbi:MAG: pyruvate dehydrogenase (acetyl-transferring) E1 component subunit alpha [Acidobacteria bacterium]|nr:MAG: pyruvate dehydrogenase (acetyl-transferring) E1 component subunit alpha [Acidobacteriota bacterium]